MQLKKTKQGQQGTTESETITTTLPPEYQALFYGGTQREYERGNRMANIFVVIGENKE